MFKMIHDRMEQIRRMLQRNPRCPIETIQRKLGVSRSTARRDLLRLEAEGQVVRVHGGAINPQVLRGDPTFGHRSNESVGAKQKAAAAAAELVRPDQSIFIDGGTTCLALARLLLLRDDLRIYTNSLPLLALAEGSRSQVICIGGQVRASSQVLVGAMAMAWLDHLRFDAAFIGASGLSIADGASTTELTEAAVKQAAMKCAECCVLLADHGKLKQVAPVRFAAWNDFQFWATDVKPTAMMARRLKAAGVRASW